ncbi:transcription factor Pcc1 [Hesseltinella vesiculosa]|uniref:Transcription factor Pcc1 n=1 Tax=Hesseltinella vesiculosa TaxID=101127 RepID=A0A1X2GM52_9FUNG|nr:transcription factor Pcc1 [Hesseltinella vesiculosa]
MDHHLEIGIPFPSANLANVAKQVLSVDKELKSDQVQRTIHVEDSLLKVHFDSVSAKMLRVSANSFMEMVLMVLRTMDDYA